MESDNFNFIFCSKILFSALSLIFSLFNLLFLFKAKLISEKLEELEFKLADLHRQDLPKLKKAVALKNIFFNKETILSLIEILFASRFKFIKNLIFWTKMIT